VGGVQLAESHWGSLIQRKGEKRRKGTAIVEDIKSALWAAVSKRGWTIGPVETEIRPD